LLDNIEQILFSPLTDLAGCEGCGGMRDEERTQAVPNLCTSDQRLNALRQIDDLLETFGTHPQYVCHTVFPSPIRPPRILHKPGARKKVLAT
jgi:hypothetical protein